MNLSSLLKTYVKKTMSWSQSSLQSLLLICRYTTLPESLSDLNMNSLAQNNVSPLETQLLQWVSNIPWKKLVNVESIENISELLIGLTLKSWSKDFKNNFKESAEALNDNLSEIEKMYLAMQYKIDIFRKTIKSREDQTIKQSKRQCNKDNLPALYSQLEDICKDSDESDDLSIIIVKCALIARILSDLKDMDVLQNGFQDFPLMPLFQKFLEKISQVLVETDLTKIRHKKLLHVMKVLRILYQVTSDRSVNQIIVNFTSVGALQKIYAFLQNIEDSDTKSKAEMYQANSDLDFTCKDILMKLANEEAERVSVVKTLALYCVPPTEGELLQKQEQLLCGLLDSDRYDFKSSNDTELVLMILEIVHKSERSIHTESSIVAVMNLLIISFQYLYKDQTSARKILCLIPKVLTAAIKLDQNVSNLVKIIVYFHNLLQERNKDIKQSYGPAMHLEFLKCLEKLILLDPSFRFAVHSETTNEKVPIIEYFLEYVNSPFYIVRMETARCIYSAVASSEIDHCWKISFFEKLKIILKDSFITNRKLKDNEKPDERIMRVTSTLHIISAVIYGSDLLKCQALFTLIYLAAQKEITSETVNKVLHIVTKGQENIVESNLDYLLMQWWHAQQSFDKFPWDLTPSETEDNFYANYMHVLLPVLIKTGNISQAVELCNQQDLNFEREFEQCFPAVIAWLLPKVCENSDSTDVKAKDILRSLETNQNEFRSVRRFIDLVHENLDRIIVLLVKELHDEKHFAELFGFSTTFPESGFMCLRASTIHDCLLFMEMHFFDSGKLIHYLATERRDILQKVLLKLTRNIYDRSGEHRLKVLYQFIFFCKIIAKEIKDFHFEEMSSFIIRDISYTLLYQIDEEDQQFAEVASKYLYMFLQSVLPEKSAVVKEIFIPIIKTLTRRVCKDEKSLALQTLRFLTVTEKDTFADVIPNLDFFPNNPVFKEMRKVHSRLRYNPGKSQNLDTEIDHFLNVSSDKNFSGTESIVRLGEQLSSRRKEFKEHYKKLESLHSFAEDCTSSKLHRLIHKLAKLMESSDPQVSQEAAKCLGLLGPGNLATMILLPDPIPPRVNSNRLEILTHKLLILLSDLVNDKNIELREASAEALYVVLSSFWCENLMKKDYLKDFECSLDSSEPRLSTEHILPFLSKSSPNTPAEIVHLEISSDLLEVDWIESFRSSYSNWIRKFSYMIANCFQNFYMKKIIPILNLSVQFCEKLLPWMVYVLFEDPKLANEMTNCINRFFQYHFAPSTDDSPLSNAPTGCKIPNCSHESVHCMLNIINFIWVQTERTVRLNLDYLSIAQGAQFCSAYFTSVLYAELWCDSFLNGNRGFCSTTLIDFIVDRDPIKGKILQDVIRKANVKIGDPDAIHGCGSTHLLDPKSRIQHYVDLKEWDKAMLMQDIELSCGVDSTKGEQFGITDDFRIV